MNSHQLLNSWLISNIRNLLRTNRIDFNKKGLNHSYYICGCQWPHFKFQSSQAGVQQHFVITLQDDLELDKQISFLNVNISHSNPKILFLNYAHYPLVLPNWYHSKILFTYLIDLMIWSIHSILSILSRRSRQNQHKMPISRNLSPFISIQFVCIKEVLVVSGRGYSP